MPFRGLTLSYGLKVFNSNRVIIDGESSTFETLQVSSAINSGAGTVLTGALIMGTRTTTGFVGGQTSSGGIFTPTDSSMSWTTLAKTSGLTGIGNTNVPAGAQGDYGLQVRNASNVLCYDSRLHANGLGMSLSNLYPTQSLSGGNIATTATLSQQDINAGAFKGAVLSLELFCNKSSLRFFKFKFSFTKSFPGNNIYWSSFTLIIQTVQLNYIF